jgi:hypothetical protein
MFPSMQRQIRWGTHSIFSKNKRGAALQCKSLLEILVGYNRFHSGWHWGAFLRAEKD